MMPKMIAITSIHKVWTLTASLMARSEPLPMSMPK